ncbi:MAG TPA: hypothetical protein VN457_05835, partial [Chlamydiales bacterium]|nr:hypothetical protein [Chlamydiales bacterium]
MTPLDTRMVAAGSHKTPGVGQLVAQNKIPSCAQMTAKAAKNASRVVVCVYDRLYKREVYDVLSFHNYFSSKPLHPKTGQAIRKIDYFVIHDPACTWTFVATARLRSSETSQASNKFDLVLLDNLNISGAVLNVTKQNATDEKTFWNLVAQINSLAPEQRKAVLALLQTCFSQYGSIQALAALFYAEATIVAERDLNKAADFAIAAVEANCKDPFVCVMLANVMLICGKRERPLQLLSAALREYPQMHFAHFVLGRFFYSQKDVEK